MADGAPDRSPADRATFFVTGPSLLAAANEPSEKALESETVRKKLRRDLNRILGKVII
jgi:hypothetical protein